MTTNETKRMTVGEQYSADCRDDAREARTNETKYTPPDMSLARASAAYIAELDRLRAENAELREALGLIREQITRERLRASIANSSLSECERACDNISRAALARKP